MTPEQERKLARLKNYRSAYELILTNGTVRYLVCYTSRKSKIGAYRAAQKRFDSLMKATGGISPWVAKPTEVFHGDEWRIYFSGRTQREAILAGELPFIGNLNQAANQEGAAA